MALTDLAIKRALPGPKIIKLSDGGGLQLWITPDGAKRWRLAYRFGGAQKALAIGVYPEVGLKAARDARDGARRNLAQGQDPSQIKKAAKVARAEAGANTFEAIAKELADKKRRDGKAAATLRKFEWFMSFALPALGSRPINGISAREVLVVLKDIEARGINENCSQTQDSDRRRFPLRHRHRPRRERPDHRVARCAGNANSDASSGHRRAESLRRIAARDRGLSRGPRNQGRP
jgi:hypothetical protein